MGKYSPSRISRFAVKKATNGVTVGFRDIEFYTLEEVLKLQANEDELEISINGLYVHYPHFVFRVLKVHGISVHSSDSYYKRLELLKFLIDREKHRQ